MKKLDFRILFLLISILSLNLISKPQYSRQYYIPNQECSSQENLDMSNSHNFKLCYNLNDNTEKIEYIPNTKESRVLPDSIKFKFDSNFSLVDLKKQITERSICVNQATTMEEAVQCLSDC